MCARWILKTSHDFISVIGKLAAKLILNIFTSNLHLMSKSVLQTRISYSKQLEMTITKLTSYLRTTVALHSLT